MPADEPVIVNGEEFLGRRAAAGPMAIEEVLYAMMPLLRQVRQAHQDGQVAPLHDLRQIKAADGVLFYERAAQTAPVLKSAVLRQREPRLLSGLDVQGERHDSVDYDAAAVEQSALAADEDGWLQPRYLPGYTNWELAAGHHDPLTDIFQLGLLAVSLACGLDLRQPEPFDTFVKHRGNLKSLHAGLHPVLEQSIRRMTELWRGRRCPELDGVIHALEHYKTGTGAAAEAWTIDDGFSGGGRGGKQRVILDRLKDRLFELNKNNRLIYFRPTQSKLNLTWASVPLMIDPKAIRPRDLMYWHDDVTGTILGDGVFSLRRHLRFDEAPYIPLALDKIISEDRQNRAEYGFSSLKLVIAFLHWFNLKEDGERDIPVHSPLLLLPVSLRKRKGVQDEYVLEILSREAEVNPALANQLENLYGLKLPASVNLEEMPPAELHRRLEAMIQASDRGVSLEFVAAPRVEIVHTKAKQRLSLYHAHRHIRLTEDAGITQPHSYDRDSFDPLGLRLFDQHVRQAPSALGLSLRGHAPRGAYFAAEATPPVIETQSTVIEFAPPGSDNPHRWSFDLTSFYLGNFNYRKMTLVRDYDEAMQRELASPGFDALFALEKRPAPAVEAPPPATANYSVVPWDPTQLAAIQLAATGGSYIIQGPPGTGKSQTITNLIADYVARGKRVLFVCEKRAALDVVFHRLAVKGLDQLAVRIHDSQADKKEFILDLKAAYERCGQPLDPRVTEARAELCAGIDRLQQDFAEWLAANREPSSPSALSIAAILDRLMDLLRRGIRPAALDARLHEKIPGWRAVEDARPALRAWLQSMQDAGFASLQAHPLLALHETAGAAGYDAILDRLRSLRQSLDALDAGLREWAALAPDTGDWRDPSWARIEALAAFAEIRLRLEQAGLLPLTADTAARRDLLALQKTLRDAERELKKIQKRNAPWRDKWPAEETDRALALAEQWQGSWLRLFSPAWWRLKRELLRRFDMARVAVRPTVAQALRELREEWQAIAAMEEKRTAFLADHGLSGEFDAVVNAVNDAQQELARRNTALPGVAKLPVEGEAAAPGNAALRRLLDAMQSCRALLSELRGAPPATLADARSWSDAAAQAMPADFPRVSTLLQQFAGLPEALRALYRHACPPLDELESHALRHELRVAAQRQSGGRFSGIDMEQKLDRLHALIQKQFDANAETLLHRQAGQFQRHTAISQAPAAQLSAAEKEFKSVYNKGRRVLEHEFGKTMRYKSIRALLGEESAAVIRDLKPIFLMSPLSVSDTLPVEPDAFDVVIFDEASQINLEEAIPPVFRAPQAIVVGDDKQLPPTRFFSGRAGDDGPLTVEDEDGAFSFDLDEGSLLTHAVKSMHSVMLRWHYRSRSESLISFSNAAFYNGDLLTVPGSRRHTAPAAPLLVETLDGQPPFGAVTDRPIAFHHLPRGVYRDRRNAMEAAYIARLVRHLLNEEPALSLGVVAFSREQQDEIETALADLAATDAAFATRLEAEADREEDGQLCGLFVKNLENVQGDERDIMILSVCYGYDAERSMRMNFGPINQQGGERRLNVVFSRAKKHMAVISSIQAADITNVYNTGANCLRQYLQYAQAASGGDMAQARAVLSGLRIARGRGDTAAASPAAVWLREALAARGWKSDLHVGDSAFTVDVAAYRDGDDAYLLGIQIDGGRFYDCWHPFEKLYLQPRVLQAFGWKIARVWQRDLEARPEAVVDALCDMLNKTQKKSATDKHR